MKAAQIETFAGREVPRIVDAVRAIGLNPFEVKVRSGAMQSFFSTPLPAILGNEISGIVDEVGEGVTDLSKGFGWSASGAYAQLATATMVLPAAVLSHIGAVGSVEVGASRPGVSQHGAHPCHFNCVSSRPVS